MSDIIARDKARLDQAFDSLFLQGRAPVSTPTGYLVPQKVLDNLNQYTQSPFSPDGDSTFDQMFTLPKPKREEPTVPGSLKDLKAQQTRLTRRIKALEAVGEDLYEDGTVVSWTETYDIPSPDDGNREYEYVALRAGGLWYVTGKRNGAYSWAELIEMWGRQPILPKLWMATGWTEA